MNNIAIIGIGCRFPGGANTPEKFWKILSKGIDTTSDVPKDRWDIETFYDKDKTKLGKAYTCHGGFLDQVDKFDAQFFGISPREAAFMDPQQRLLMETSWESLEDAGLNPVGLAGKDVGVFIGAFTLDYKVMQFNGSNRDLIDTHTATGALMTMLSNRLSYVFDFHGPSMTVDTACSSSLVSVHLACRSLLNNECSIALAGGVNVMLTPEYTIAESKGGFLSPDGHCKAFDASANGYARGEGAGVIVLKPLDKALEDGDSIYAVIRGTGVNQDGHTNGITVPSGEAQETLMKDTYKRAGILPGEVGYVEAHGTGTAVGDPIEANAIANVFSIGRPKGKKCVIGSVKTNIGHLEAAAGVAGIIKSALILQKKKIPPNIHFHNPNPKIDFENSCLHIPTTLEEWPEEFEHSYIGVNSFGFGGTNAHIILEEAPKSIKNQYKIKTTSVWPKLIPISARSEDALKELAKSYRDFTKNHSEVSLQDIAYSASKHRAHHNFRLAVVADSKEEFIESLESFMDGEMPKEISKGIVVPHKYNNKIVFVYTGMGPIWWAMARELIEKEPIVKNVILKCDEYTRKYAGWSIMNELTANESNSRFDQPQYSQPANFAVQVALTELWHSFGVEPDAIIGHSLGEVSAMYVSGVYSFEDAMKVSLYRSSVLQHAIGKGTMLAVGMSKEDAKKILVNYSNTVSIGAINSPKSVTFSGERSSLEKIEKVLNNKGIFARMLKVNVAYHSYQMAPYKDELIESLKDIKPRTAKIPIYSTVTGKLESGEKFDGKYWWKSVSQSVLFEDAINEIIDDKYNLFVEIGPHPVLSRSIKECLEAKKINGEVLSTLRRKVNDRMKMFETLGNLYTIGYPIDWNKINSNSGNFVKLPLYPWQREKYWNESEEAREIRIGEKDHPLLGRRLNTGEKIWENEISPYHINYLADHKIQNVEIFPGAAYVEMGIACAKSAFGEGLYSIEDIKFYKTIFLNKDNPIVQLTLNSQNANFEISSHLKEDNKVWTKNASGKIVRKQVINKVIGKSIDTMIKNCNIQLSKEKCYKKFSEMGFDYGTNFQRLEKVWKGSNGAIGTIRTEGIVGDEYTLHPTILDAAFQLMIALVADFDNDSQSQEKVFLPVGIKSVQLYDSIKSELWCCASVKKKYGSLIVGDIKIFDNKGNILVYIDSFTAQVLQKEKRGYVGKPKDWLHELKWIEKERENNVECIKKKKGTWIVFSDNHGTGKQLVNNLEKNDQNCITIHLANKYKSIKNGKEYYVNPLNVEHFETMIRKVIEDYHYPVCGIVHLWSLDNEEKEATSQYLNEAENNGCLSILHLTQAIIKTEIKPKMWIITRGCQMIDSDTTVSSLVQSPMWGIGRVIGHQEAPNIWGGLIDLNPKASDKEGELLFNQIWNPDDEDQVAFRDNRRFVIRLVPMKMKERIIPTSFKSNGSYILTGAFGALGKIVGNWMVEHGARHLILLGRSKISARSEWKNIDPNSSEGQKISHIKSLEAMGANVHVASLDVSDKEQLNSFLIQYNSEGWPSIKGVIHTAGVVEDKLLPMMTDEAFKRVTKPKIMGAWNLHNELKNEDLDFFILFSSNGSVITSVGQTNYASGNAFLDALATYRRSKGLPGLAINWGPWDEVGMAANLNLIDKYYRERGMNAITPALGMNIIELLIGQNKPLVVICNANWETVFKKHYPAGKAPRMLWDLVKNKIQPKEIEDDYSASILKQIRLCESNKKLELIQKRICELVSKIFRMATSKIDINQQLIYMGLDSMMAIELKNKIETEFQISVSIVNIIQGPSIVQISKKIFEKLNDNERSSSYNKDDDENNENIKQEEYHEIKVVEKKKFYEVSSAQKRIYIVSQIQGDLTNYNIPVYATLVGKLDTAKFERSILQLIKKHEVFRTTFDFVNGEPVQIIHDNVDFKIEYLDGNEDNVDEIMDRFVRPFDLSKAPLLRVSLVKFNENKHLLMVDMHHIISDGKSIGIFLKSVIALYLQRDVPEMKIQYKDFAVWQNNLLKEKAIKKQEQYWLDVFKDEIPLLDMPTDYVRPSIQNYDGDVISFSINKELMKKLNIIAKKSNATIFMVLTAAFNVLLYKYTGQEDIVIGTPIEGRTHPDVENLIGVFINTLAIRNYPVKTKTFIEFLGEVRENLLKAYENQDYQFEELIDKLEIRRDLARNPLFDVMFVMQPMDNPVSEFGDMKYIPCKYNNKSSKFDITLHGVQKKDSVSLDITYCTALFKRKTMERFAQHFLNILAIVAEDSEIKLSNINMLSLEEKDKLLNEFNNKEVKYENNKTIQRLFEIQVEKTPNNIAVEYEGKKLTYRELNEKANSLARVLRKQGVRAESIVAIMMDRSLEMIFGILGVLKAGGAYLPIDPEYPDERINYMIKDSNTNILLTQSCFMDKIKFDGIVINLEDEELYKNQKDNLGKVSGTNNLAYIIYTSGTTGKPKGVMITQKGLVNYICWARKVYVKSEHTDFPLYSSISFDLTVTSIYTPLISGNKLVIYEGKDKILLVRKIIKENKVDIIKLTPTHLKLIEDMDLSKSRVKKLILGGEDLKENLARKIYNAFNGNVSIYNEYGPTETTVGCMIHEYDITKDTKPSVSIGVPADNTQIYVLGKNLELLPIGTVGELCVGGNGVARGYLNREELTKEKFVENPFSHGERIYKTGDLARWINDGTLEYLGRIDDQVKIRGFRVELDEIASTILKKSNIKETVVVPKYDINKNIFICAYIISDDKVTITEMRKYLAEYLPDYMIPSYFMQLKKLPLTTNGKVNVAALPQPDWEKIDSGVEYVAPRNEIEEIILKVWQEVLGVKNIGIEDNFFALGGDSIKAIQVVAHLRKYNCKLQITNLIQNPTIEKVSKYVKIVRSKNNNSMIEGRIELTPFQKMLLEADFNCMYHYNLSFMLYKKDRFDEKIVRKVFNKILEHHDALRIIFMKEKGEIVQFNRLMNKNLLSLEVFDLTNLTNYKEEVLKYANVIQNGMDLINGPLVKLGLFKTKDGDHLLITIHQLIIDHVSWRIIFEDFAKGYADVSKGKDIKLPAKTTSYKEWAEKLQVYADSDELLKEIDYWKTIDETEVSLLPKDNPLGTNTWGDTKSLLSECLSEGETDKLLKYKSNDSLETDAILFTALGITLKELTLKNKFAVTLGSHGRQDVIKDIDISRTVGRFTAMYPAIIEILDSENILKQVQSIKNMLKNIPKQGIGYSILKYLTSKENKKDLKFNLTPEIAFSYMGQFDQDVKTNVFDESNLPVGETRNPCLERSNVINIISMVAWNKLNIRIDYSTKQFNENTIEKLADSFSINLKKVINCVMIEHDEAAISK